MRRMVCWLHRRMVVWRKGDIGESDAFTRLGITICEIEDVFSCEPLNGVKT